MKVRALHTPGHTPSCITYHIGDAVFVGDTLFMVRFLSPIVDPNAKGLLNVC
jgi:glyoxylase-like metal-dependent hydrolase (beta-lactamase superfamily II)